MTIIDSRVDAVKVYAVGATVSRRLTISANGGRLPATIEVPGLPLSLDDTSVRVRLSEPVEDAEVVFGDVHVGLYAALSEELPDKPDEEALRDLERRIQRRESLMEQLEGERDLLSVVTVDPRPQGEEGKAPPPSPLAARVALEGFTHELAAARDEELAELRAELTRLREAAADLRDKIARWSTSQKVSEHEVTKTAVIAVRHDGEPVDEVEAILDYRVPGARWYPQYQCYIDARAESATIQSRAVICQSSGEDWSGVDLKLSTSSPTAFSELPKLQAIKIGKKQQPVDEVKGFRPPPKGYAALYEDFDRGRRAGLHAAPSPGAVSVSAPPAQRPAIDALMHYAVAMRGGARDGAGVSDVMEESAEEEEVLYSLAADEPTRGFSASPAAAAAPAPPPAARAPSRKRARRAAPEAEKKELAAFGSASGGKGGGGGLDAYGGPGGEAAAPAPVTFGALRLPPAGDRNGRNRLQPVDARQRYLETLSRSGLSPSTDVMDMVARAERVADAARSTSAPSGCVDFSAATSNFAYAFSADARVDVPSDGAFHSVPVTRLEAPCHLTYVVVPRVDRNVFRVARVENPSNAPLLAGPIEIYVGGEYILSTSLPVVSPRERFKLGLGVEQRIKCARNTTYAETRSGSAVVATSELHHTIAVDLVNNLPGPITCEVRERIPVPGEDEEVVVEVVAVDPAWEEWDQREAGRLIRGGYRWSVQVAAGAEETLKAEYVVKIYANNELTGGNRRER